MDADLLVLAEWRLGPGGRGGAWVPLCRAPGAPSESGPGSHRGNRLAHRALAGAGEGRRGREGRGLPAPRPWGEGREQQLLERQKLLFPC